MYGPYVRRRCHLHCIYCDDKDNADAAVVAIAVDNGRSFCFRCLLVEWGFKALFSDLKPKDIALRRPEQTAREEKRRKDAADKAEQERIAEIERKRGVADTIVIPAKTK
jgi:hypothetical protein